MIVINTNQILTEVIQKLDLTPTQYMKIQNSYKALAEELQKTNDNVELYSQGSIRLGTTVRPYTGTSNADYDVDLVAQYLVDKDTVTPENVRKLVGDVLKENETYSKKIQEKKRCWRIEYAEQDGLGFHADILPAIPEDETEISLMLADSKFDNLKDLSIAITHKENTKSAPIWSTSNPKGYAKWFDSINRDGKQQLFEQRKQVIFLENKELFAKIDDIPDALVKTPLQRVIQVLKRHRDVYFARDKREDDKPISIIITTLVVEIVKIHELQNLNFQDLLIEVCRQLVKAGGLVGNQDFSVYDIRSAIYRDKGEWKIPNPVNMGENFADAWNKNANKPKTFFTWLDAVNNDIVQNLNNEEFEKVLCEILAFPYEKTIKNQKNTIIVNEKSTSQPWGKNV